MNDNFFLFSSSHHLSISRESLERKTDNGSRCENFQFYPPLALNVFFLSNLKLVHEHVLMTPEEKTELLQR